MLDFNTGFALVVQLVNTIFPKKAARWNFQFDIGKQRRNTLFRFMNTLVQFCGEHAGSVSCRFCVLDLLLSNSFPEYSNKNRGAVVNRALKKRGLSAKRDSPALQQIYEKRSI